MVLWFASICELVWDWYCLCNYHSNLYEVFPSVNAGISIFVFQPMICKYCYLDLTLIKHTEALSCIGRSR